MLYAKGGKAQVGSVNSQPWDGKHTREDTCKQVITVYTVQLLVLFKILQYKAKCLITTLQGLSIIKSALSCCVDYRTNLFPSKKPCLLQG